jgi:hypothetical protein
MLSMCGNVKASRPLFLFWSNKGKDKPMIFTRDPQRQRSQPMSGYNYESFGQCDVDAPDFWLVAQLGARAPDFSLPDLDGNMISLASFAGKKHVLLEFGSIT